jgi:hypothetical protein
MTTVLFIPPCLSYLPVHSSGAVSARQKPSPADRLLLRAAGWPYKKNNFIL